MSFTLAGIAAKFTANKGADFIEKVSNVADKWIDTKAEKAERILDAQKLVQDYNLELIKEANISDELYLKDKANARDNYTKILESDHTPWYVKAVMPTLTIIVTVGFLGLLVYMLKYEVPKSNERIMDILLGSLGTAWITIISFYFGSSKGSEDKGKELRNLKSR